MKYVGNGKKNFLLVLGVKVKSRISFKKDIHNFSLLYHPSIAVKNP